MKRPLQLPLAIALALSGTDALALGLGAIHVNSKLNQPLDAEIPILQGTAGEAEGLLVQMAAAEDFDRVGLNRSRLTVPLEFSIVKTGKGEMAIKVTSKEIVREPFLDFLVEANWPKGRLLREYTVLLDPPVMAPATGSAVTAAAKAPERAPVQALPQSKPAPAKPKPPAPVAVAPRAEAAPSKPAPAAPAPKRAAGDNEYTVEAGDTLSGIARTVRGDESTNVNQLMLALLKQNPNAFFQNNINALKRGAILRIPSAEDVKAVGSAGDAAAEVRTQIEDWRGGAAAKPTLVADTGSAPAPKPAAPAAKTPPPSSTAMPTAKATTGSERLELVPPKAGKDSIAMADRPGSGAGTAGASTELKTELARTKEALTSREQEAGELKSRVKELEDTKSKTDRLISLKDSEIADLQRKLKELQDQSKTGAKTTVATTTPPPAPPPAPAATTPSATAAAGTATTKADTVSKEDIWGNATTDTKTAATAAKAPAATAPPATAPATGATTPTVSSPTTPVNPGASAPTSSTPASTPSASPTAATPILPGPTVAVAPGGTDTAKPATAAASPPKPAASTMPVKDTKTKLVPLAPSAPPWYQQSWVKPAAIGAVALLLLAGLLGMRRRKTAVATERGSIAGAFGDSPLRSVDNGALAGAATDSEEDSLRDQLMRDPGNVGLHLELLSLLYAERNVAGFEDAAEVMHMHVVDAYQPEWLEAKAMGQELAPHNPLFSDDEPTQRAFDDVGPFDEAVTAPHATTRSAFAGDDVDDVFNHQEPVTQATPRSNAPVFDFDLDADTPLAPPPAAPEAETSFGFDNLPPLDFGKEPRSDIDAAPEPAPLHVDEDEFPGEDGVGTKLDLAKAYLDMGDPEGARSMLEEVLAEGSDVQKGEARRLMAEIR
jgi:pilus assembly protein FimV